jgi:uncharacterized membrane protein
MVENQSNHRQQMEKISVQAQADDILADRAERRRGQAYGFMIALAFILTGSSAILFVEAQAAQICGAIFGGTGAIGLVSLFVIGKEKKLDAPKPKSESSARKTDGAKSLSLDSEAPA